MSNHQSRVAGDLGIPLRRHARNRRVAIAIRTTGRDVTYGQLDEQVSAAAAGLHAHGLRPGGTIAIFMENSIEWLVTYFAAARIGAVVAPINVLASASELDDILREIDASVLVTSPSLAGKSASGIAACTVVAGADPSGAGVPAIPWTDLFRHGTFDGPGPASTDVATLYYSSATTGRSKAAMTLHSDIALNAMQQIIEIGLSEDDTHLVTASMSWAAGLHGLTLATLYVGGTIVLPELGAMNAEKLAAAITEWCPTTVILVPTLLRRLVEEPASLRQLAASELRVILTGSEPVPLPLFERVTEELPDIAVMQAYGMSEFPMMITLLRPEDARERVGSAGRPTFFTEMELLTEEGDQVRTGEGEILIRTPSTTRGYWRRDEETELGMRDGWLHTGDLGRMDDDGFVWITGRSKDLIITGGLNVAPLEIERVLARASSGREVAVVGVPDREFGERIVAVFGGEEPVDAAQLVDACKEVLPSYKVPRRFFTYGSELPKGPTGKLLKRAIRPWAEAEVASDVG